MFTHLFIVLGFFTYSSTALVWQQTSRLPDTVGFQNDLGFNAGAEPTISPTTVTDFKPFVPTSTPSNTAISNIENPASSGDALPAIAIDRRGTRNTNSETRLVPRKFAPPGLQEGFNAATVRPNSPATIATMEENAPFETLDSVPYITEDAAWSDEFLTPTTTVTTTVMGSTIYYTESTVTITPRDVIGLEGRTAKVPLSRATPQTFQTITGSPSLASLATQINQ